MEKLIGQQAGGLGSIHYDECKTLNGCVTHGSSVQSIFECIQHPVDIVQSVNNHCFNAALVEQEIYNSIK